MPKKILIVEDEECLLNLASIILEARGYDVVGVSDGTQALELLTRSVFDLVLLDVMLPDIDGFEVCQRIKQRPENSALPVVMLTAKKDREDFARGVAVGAAWYITKPFKSGNVIEVVERLTK